MAKPKIRNIALFAKNNHPATRALVEDLAQMLEVKGIGLLAEKNTARLCRRGRVKVRLPEAMVRAADLVVVIGGDGTLLRASHFSAPLGIPLLGVNSGRLGYVTSVPASDLLWAVREALKGGLRAEARAMLCAKVVRQGRVVGSFLVLNDIVISRSVPGRLIDLDTFVDTGYLTTYRCDGLLLATATGSTAYALSIGGPILHPRMRNLVLAPIAPHTLSNRPLVLSEGSAVEMAVPGGQTALMLNADGQKCRNLLPLDRIKVEIARETTLLLLPKNQQYWEILRNKLGWGG